jgi:hypothetical protein
MKILIDTKAAEYIKARGGSVRLGLQFEPSMGGCACSASRLLGTHVPQLALGAPLPDDCPGYECLSVTGVDVYCVPGLKLKQGSQEARIRLGGALGIHWLELEGVRGVSCLDEEDKLDR